MPGSPRHVTRRRFLAGAAGAAGALVLPSSHLAWVWDFTRDGPPEPIIETLAAYGLGIALKSHDGVEWMAKYDHSKSAVSGPKRIAQLADTFESRGVPFYCWCVVHGTDPVREATMAADVLGAGTRGLFVDLESYPGFWTGSAAAAGLYGKLLRKLRPDASVLVTVDARPWEMSRIPLREFASFASAIAPQVYWTDFATANNIKKYRSEGEDPGAAGVTPAFALDAAARKIGALELPAMPLMPIGPGIDDSTKTWKQFIDQSYSHRARSISVWRLGTTSTRVLELLKQNPPPGTYVVRSGDSLGALAIDWGTSVDAIVQWNHLSDANMVRIGQHLVVPPSGHAPPPAPTTYQVQPGDTLIGLAARWHTTPDRIAQVNGISDRGYIRIGQALRVP